MRVFAPVRENIESMSFTNYLKDDADIEGTCKPYMNDILIDNEEISKIINKLNNNAAMGPDGLPVQVYKYGGKMIVEAISDNTRDSIESGICPQILKLGWE